MAYAVLGDITAELPADVWDGSATADPAPATVTGWIDEEGQAVESAVSQVVSAPVSSTASPRLYQTFGLIVILRVVARVERKVFGLRGGESGANPSEREKRAKQMEDLIRGGAIADGSRVGGGAEGPGSPSGYFGEDDEDSFFGRSDQF